MRDLILAGIRAGDFRDDSSLDEEHLMRAFSASRGAVRGALNQLSALGVLERRPRTGTRVVDPGLRLAITDIGLDRLGGVTIDVLEQRVVPATPFLQDRLSIDDEVVRMVENSFTFDSEIIGLRTAYFSVDVKNDPSDLDGPMSMPELIRDFFDTEPGAVYVWIGAEACDARTSRILHIAEGAVLLRREITYFDLDSRPIEIVFDAFRADRVSFDKGPMRMT